MTLRDRLRITGQVFRTGELPTKEVVRIKESKQKLSDLLGGMIDLSPRQLSGEKSISTKLLQANKGWVYRNNDVIAMEVSKMEFELYTVGLSKGEIVYNEVNSHPLLDILDKPNPEATKSDFLYTTQSHKKLTGDSFWLKVRKNGEVVYLRSLEPDKVELILSQPTEADPAIITGYKYRDIVDGKQISQNYRPEDIIHFKKPNPRNPFRGYGAVEALSETIDLDNLTSEVMMSYLKNGAIHNFALTTDQKVTDDQLRRLKAEMRAAISGPKNAFNVPIFGGGMKPADISYSNKEQQLIDQLEWYRDKIMVGFGNTKASLGMIDDVNRASHESSLVEWKRNTVAPDMAAIVNTLNEYLVPEFGDNLILGFCDPVPEDRGDDIVEATNLFKSGIITRNEARGVVDYDADTNGDVYLTPTSSVEQPASPEADDEA